MRMRLSESLGTAPLHELRDIRERDCQQRVRPSAPPLDAACHVLHAIVVSLAQPTTRPGPGAPRGLPRSMEVGRDAAGNLPPVS